MSDYEKNIKNFCETYKQNAKINNVNSLLCIYQINNILSEIAFYVYNGEITFSKKFKDNVITILPEDLKGLFALYVLPENLIQSVN